jgi:hypothetical protein
MARPRTNRVDSFEALTKLRKSIKIAAQDLSGPEFEQVMADANVFADAQAIEAAQARTETE